jgi:serine/threonine-protein kinase
MHQHLTADPVPPSRLRPELPPALDAVIAQALHKDRENRFADAAAMRTALTAAARATPPPPVPTPTAYDPRAADVPDPGAAAPPAPQDGGPAPQPARRRPARVVFRPTAEGAVALLGCLLSLVISRTDVIEGSAFSRVALLAAVAGAVLLLWSARLACAVAWGPVAEAVAVLSGLARGYVGWDTHYVILALMLGVVAALCLVAGYRDERSGGFALVAFWFTALTAVWFFLDDLRKIGVFYVLLLSVPLAIGAQVLKSRTRPPSRGPVAGPHGAAQPPGTAPAGRRRARETAGGTAR